MNRIAELAEFCGMERSPITNVDVSYCYPNKPLELFLFNPYEDWNDCMLVEARLREKGLWAKYVYALFKLVCDDLSALNFTHGEIGRRLMAATKEQRMQAALAVIERKADE
jgi:hypothetical protein